MRYATRIALAAFAFVLWAGPAAAQNDVTFKVDLNAYKASCQFDPVNETVFVRGSFQKTDSAPDGFTLANPLSSTGDGIYSGTVSLPEGPITYKFYVGKNSDPNTSRIVSWENGSDRPYTVTAGAQTIPTATFNGPDVANTCGSVDTLYDVTFAVDLSIQQSLGIFNPNTQNVAVVGGALNAWDTSRAIPLAADAGTPGVYAGTAQVTLSAPGFSTFKFIIRNNSDGGTVVAWDAVNPARTADNSGGGDPDRVIRLTGNETDLDGNGRPDFFYDNDSDPSTFPYFRDQTREDFLDAPATVTFNVDMRPAQYRIADTGALPAVTGSNPSTGNTAITGLFINGPAAGRARANAASTIADWAGWGAELQAQTSRELTDPDGDGIYSLTYEYEAGLARNLVAKFGVNGADDEALAPVNHNFPVQTGQNTFNIQFGCMRQRDGSFVDDAGANPTANPPVNAPYDEYLLVDNVARPQTCRVVRNGGLNDANPVAIGSGPEISGIEIGSAYPNPLRGSGRIDLTLDRPMTVSARVYDVTGRTVATLLDGRDVAAGRTTVDLDVSRLAAGVYVLRIEADGQVASRRMTVTR